LQIIRMSGTCANAARYSRSIDIEDPASSTLVSRRFFENALKHELLLRPIGKTVYLMPPYILARPSLRCSPNARALSSTPVIGGRMSITSPLFSRP